MTITYTRTYRDAMVKDVGDLVDVVQSFQCVIVGTEDDVSIELNNRVDLSNPDPSKFVEFKDLTAEILDEWTNEYLDIGSIELDIANKIISIVNTRDITSKPLPF